MYYRYVTGWSPPDGADLDGPEFSVRDNEIAYVFPSDSATACLALSFALAHYSEARKDPAGWFDQRLEEHRGLWGRYERAVPVGRLYAGPPHDSVVRVPAGPGWALVGDAGTLQDPWSGSGWTPPLAKRVRLPMPSPRTMRTGTTHIRGLATRSRWDASP